MNTALVSVRRDRQLGAVWMPEMPSTARRLAVAGDPVAMMRAGVCPFCGAGPFTVVAIHTTQAHGVDRFALRDEFGLIRGVSICDPAYARACSERMRETTLPRPRTRGTPRLSTAGRARQSAAAIRRNSKLHTCTAIGCCNLVRGKRTPTCSDECKQRSIAHRATARIKLRTCTAVDCCNLIRGVTGRRRTCSDECTERNIGRVGYPSRRRQCECHPDRPHSALGLCRECYMRQRRAR